jgi:uncharacterized surface protein with fasciclin (FAS1) repeats
MAMPKRRCLGANAFPARAIFKISAGSATFPLARAYQFYAAGNNAQPGGNNMLRRTFFATAATAVLALSAPAFAGGHSKDIVDTAIDAGSFTTLVAAVQAAGLVETLKGEGPFTVFAPTDAAFAALPEGTVEALLADPEALAAILTYHVVPGAVMSGDLVDDMKAATVNGAEITVDLSMGVMINDATVTTADIEASNGVIHVIDKVMLPPEG